MNVRHAILIAALSLSVASCGNTASNQTAAAPAPVDAQAVEAEVRAFVESYNGFYGANDMDNYFASFDPGLTQWWPSGRVDLKTYETNWRKGVAAGGGNSKVAVTDLQVQVGPSGDAAVATYILEVTPRVAGKAQDKVERNQETDVLYKIGGQWKVVHVNYGPARPPKDAPAQ